MLPIIGLSHLPNHPTTPTTLPGAWSVFGDDYVTVAEAAKRTGYSVRQIRHLLETNQVAGQKPGRDWFVSLPSLIEHQQTVRPGRKPTRRRPQDHQT